MQEKTIDLSRGTVHYWVSHAGGADCRPLVFLPGLTADHRLFRHQTAHFEGKNPLLVWDAPGHGKSRPYHDYSYAHLAEDLNEILDREGFQNVVLVGQSAGGFTAQAFLADYGHRVDGFFSIGSTPCGTGYYSKSDLFWLRQLEWMSMLFPDGLLRSSMAKMCGHSASAQENMMEMLLTYGKKELCHLLYLGEAAFIPEIRDISIDCPVWLTLGEHDQVGKVRQYNKVWHQRTGYPLHYIQDAAHNANDDAPEEVNRLLEQFLESL